MKRILYENGLSIALFGLFIFSFVGMSLTGHHEYNQDQQTHHQQQISYGEYLSTGHFMESVFENWESEFLQMAAYIAFTAFLYQKGSSESKEPGKVELTDFIPDQVRQDPQTPWPVRRGGWVLRVYENSLTLVLSILFLLSFILHAVGGAKAYNSDNIAHGGTEPLLSTFEYMGTSRFWFESFQNWQSEFFSIGMMVVLSIWLRQKGSPESKPVYSSHSTTGK